MKREYEIPILSYRTFAKDSIVTVSGTQENKYSKSAEAVKDTLQGSTEYISVVLW